jgi:hypothetical protein
LAEAYSNILKSTGSGYLLTALAGVIPYFRQIVPIDENKKFNYAVDVVDRVSKKLVEDKNINTKSNGKDLLSLLININKTLPIEEKMTNVELQNQVINIHIYTVYCILYLLKL